MRKLGLKLDFSDAEINYILGISEDNYKGPKKGENLKEYAKRIAERNTGTRYSGKSNKQNKRNILQSAPISLILPAEVELAGADYTNLSRSIYNTIADAHLQEGETMTGYAYSGNYFCIFIARDYDSANVEKLIPVEANTDLIQQKRKEYERANISTNAEGSRSKGGARHRRVPIVGNGTKRSGVLGDNQSTPSGITSSGTEQVGRRSAQTPPSEWDRTTGLIGDSDLRYRQKENKKDVLPRTVGQ